MIASFLSRRVLASFCVMVFAAATASAQAPAAQQEEFVPQVGQAGKDVVWVPTPPELVEKMLDLAKVTPQDFVMDLGSGDGRNVIAAAKRGARGDRRRVQPGHGGAVEAQRRRSRRRRQGARSSRATCTRPTSRRRP